MKKQENKFSNQGIKHSHTAGRWLRLICAVLCTCTVLLTFVGCDYVKAEEVALLQGEIEALKKSNASRQEEIEALKKADSVAKEEIASLRGDNTASAQKIGQLEGELNGAKEEIEALKESQTAAQQEITSLKETNEAAQRELDALKTDREAALQEIEALKAQIEALQNGTEPVEKIKIYIDQGHNPTGKHNAGASGNGLNEEDLTFEIGKLLAQLLKADGRFEICLSRPWATTVLGTDNTSSLEARVQGAVEFGADYFISLHTNAYESDTANGIEVYAAEEGSVSYDFGSALLEGMLDSTGLANRRMKTNPDLHVLKNATMPAVLLEMGFITNVQDATVLSEHPELFAQGIYNGLLAYFDLQPNSSADAQ